jgi:cytochrome c oxidase subunit 3
MWIFLASLAVLFAASVAAYLVVRARAEVWPPPDMPALPRGLWVSTVVILISSGTIQGALASIRRGRYGALIGLLLITTLLGLVFLVSQAVNWAWLISLQATASAGLYMFTFYMLTALHGLHVIGGLGLLVVVTAKAFVGRYSAGDHTGVRHAAMYWHFLDGVWLVMFVLLFLV